MKAALVLHTLYRAILDLFSGKLFQHRQAPQDFLNEASASPRQYLVSHIDDYGDCV